MVVNVNGRPRTARVTGYQKVMIPVKPELLIDLERTLSVLYFYGVATSVYILDYKVGGGKLEALLWGIAAALSPGAFGPVLRGIVRDYFKDRDAVVALEFTQREEGW